jgi:hypothetical protein
MYLLHQRDHFGSLHFRETIEGNVRRKCEATNIV